jgi:enamine deaminase RidA (YjgF/YER057c/UK114 family)
MRPSHKRTILRSLGKEQRTRTEFFSNFFPEGDFPASTLVVVKGLADPRWLIEIEAVAAIPE